MMITPPLNFMWFATLLATKSATSFLMVSWSFPFADGPGTTGKHSNGDSAGTGPRGGGEEVLRGTYCRLEEARWLVRRSEFR